MRKTDIAYRRIWPFPGQVSHLKYLLQDRVINIFEALASQYLYKIFDLMVFRLKDSVATFVATLELYQSKLCSLHNLFVSFKVVPYS